MLSKLLEIIFFYELPGAFLIVLRKVFLSNIEKSDVAFRGTEQALDVIDIDVGERNEHPGIVIEPVVGNGLPGPEQSFAFPDAQVTHAMIPGAVPAVEDHTSDAPSIIFRQESSASVQVVPEYVDDLAHQFFLRLYRIHLDPDAVLDEVGASAITEVSA